MAIMRIAMLLCHAIFYALIYGAPRSWRGTRLSRDMSMPSRTIASSLARNSTEHAPASVRGSLNTPASRRLHHSTKPSRSLSNGREAAADAIPWRRQNSRHTPAPSIPS